jgi:hypothetical protein
MYRIIDTNGVRQFFSLYNYVFFVVGFFYQSRGHARMGVSGSCSLNLALGSRESMAKEWSIRKGKGEQKKKDEKGYI